MDNKILALSTVKIKHSPDLYKMVDSLNRSLGLALVDGNSKIVIPTMYRA